MPKQDLQGPGGGFTFIILSKPELDPNITNNYASDDGILLSTVGPKTFKPFLEDPVFVPAGMNAYVKVSWNIHSF